MMILVVQAESCLILLESADEFMLPWRTISRYYYFPIILLRIDGLLLICLTHCGIFGAGIVLFVFALSWQTKIRIRQRGSIAQKLVPQKTNGQAICFLLILLLWLDMASETMRPCTNA